MKTQLKLLALFLMLSSLAFTGCSDDDDAPAPSREQLLVAKNWVLTAITVNPALFNPQTQTEMSDLFPLFPLCKRDDFTNYMSNGTYIVEEGASKCDPNDPNTVENGTYTWNSDKSVIIHNQAQGQGSYEYIVKTLNSDQLIVEQVTVEDNIVYTFTVTFN